MAMVTLHEDLFEEMRRRLGCLYISDIPFVGEDRVLRSLAALPAGTYTEAQVSAFRRYVGRDAPTPRRGEAPVVGEG